MTEFTVDQLKSAARRAYDAGDTARAKRFIDEARRVEALTADKSSGREVIETTPDGGKIYRSADGALSFSSPNYSTNDPEAIARLRKGATPAQESTSSFDRQTIGQYPAASRAAKAIQGVPFAGQWADEAVGVVSPNARDAMRATQSAMDRENPVESLGLQIGGGVVGSIPMALAAGPAVIASAPASLGARVALGATAGATAGAAEGFVSGAGRGNNGDRGATAANDAVWGAGAGAVMGAAAPAIASGARRVLDWVKGTDVAATKRALGVGTNAARIINQDIAALDPTQAARNLSAAGPDAMLADAGGPVRELLDTSIAGGGKASQAGTEAVYGRAAKAGERLDNTLNAIFGKAQGIYTSARKIAERTAPMRQAAYDRAYKTPIDYSTGGAGDNILNVMKRIPARVRDKAVQIANDQMQMRGTSNKQILLTVTPDGRLNFGGTMPNVEQLDEIKKALGVIGAEVDNLGRPTYEARLAGSLAGQLRDSIEGAAPGYKAAVRLGGDKIAEDNALTLGRKIADMPREDVEAFVAGKPSLQAQAAAKQGIREWLDQVISRVRRNPDNPDVDIPETTRLLSMLSSDDVRKKIGMVLGDQKAALLFREIDAAGKQFGTMRAIATGSQTARRTARLGRIEDEFGGATPSASPVEWATQSLKWLTGRTKTAKNEAVQRGLSEIATALTTMRGQEAQDALRVITSAINGQVVRDADVQRLSRTLSAAVSLLGYQTGSQSGRQQTGAMQAR